MNTQGRPLQYKNGGGKFNEGRIASDNTRGKRRNKKHRKGEEKRPKRRRRLQQRFVLRDRRVARERKGGKGKRRKRKEEDCVRPSSETERGGGGGTDVGRGEFLQLSLPRNCGTCCLCPTTVCTACQGACGGGGGCSLERGGKRTKKCRREGETETKVTTHNWRHAQTGWRTGGPHAERGREQHVQLHGSVRFSPYFLECGTQTRVLGRLGECRWPRGGTLVSIVRRRD